MSASFNAHLPDTVNLDTVISNLDLDDSSIVAPETHVYIPHGDHDFEATDENGTAKCQNFSKVLEPYFRAVLHHNHAALSSLLDSIIFPTHIFSSDVSDGDILVANTNVPHTPPTLPFNAGAYCPLEPPLPNRETFLSTPFTHHDHKLSAHPDCKHTLKEIDLAEKIYSSFASNPNSNIIRANSDTLSHSLYLGKFCEVLEHIYHIYTKNGCPTCFFSDQTLWSYDEETNQEKCIDNNCYTSIRCAIVNTIHLNELGLWKLKHNQQAYHKTEFQPCEFDDESTDDAISVQHPYTLISQNDGARTLHDYQYNYDVSSYICGIIAVESPADICELYEPGNSTYTPQKWHNDISLFSAALNCQNYVAFEMLLNKCQELYQYVGVSLLYDLIECGEYHLYNVITNFNSKLGSSAPPLHTQYINGDDAQTVEKYAHISFIKPDK